MAIEAAKDAAMAELKEKELTIQEAIEELVRLYADIYWISRQGINNGLCEDFAWALCDLIDGAEAHWGDELCTGADTDNEQLYAYHCFVMYQGRAYDSEAPEGEDDFRDLPLYLRGMP